MASDGQLRSDILEYQQTAPKNLVIPQSDPSLPPRPEFPPFTALNLCGSASIDEGDFSTFPERHGWVIHHKDIQCHALCPPAGICLDDIEDDLREAHYKLHGPISPMLSRADGTTVTHSTKAAFLQAWLFFGTLREMSIMCGLSIDVREEFIVDGERRVSTAALNGMAGRWFRSLDPEKVGNITFMEGVLAIARKMALLLRQEVSSRPACKPTYEYTPEEAQVLFSMDVLLRVLALHLILHVNSPVFSSSPECKDWNPTEHISNFITYAPDQVREGRMELMQFEKMTATLRGWCTSETQPSYPDSMEGFKLALSRDTLRTHTSCGYMVCRAYQVIQETYKTAHTIEGCWCDFVGVQGEELVEKLEADQVPVVTITNELKLQVVASEEYPYIALSHVWADGLGNQIQNALPHCQLRRLHEYITRLRHIHGKRLGSSAGGPIAFWMDTLCIPVDPRFKKYRNKAIHLMAATFHSAAAVLVVDKELEAVDTSTTSFLELGIRILRSGWMKRLWTWEEAVFALKETGDDGAAGGAHETPPPRRLYFQMRDGPFYLWEYLRGRANMFEKHPWSQVDDVLLDEEVVMDLDWQISDSNVGGREDFSTAGLLILGLCGRSTSKAEDVPVCAAAIFGIDVAPILAATNQESRLAALYRLLPSIPETILWVEDPKVKRLAAAPFRWAPVWLNGMPRKFINSMGPTEEESVRCDDQGRLHVRYSGFMLDTEILGRGAYLLVSVDASSGEVRPCGQIRRSTTSWSSENNSEWQFDEAPYKYRDEDEEGLDAGSDVSEEPEEESGTEEEEEDDSEDAPTGKAIVSGIKPSSMRLAVILKPRRLAVDSPYWTNAAVLRIQSDADNYATSHVEHDDEDETARGSLSALTQEPSEIHTEITATIIGYAISKCAEIFAAIGIGENVLRSNKCLG